jgi:hypothetical protein
MCKSDFPRLRAWNQCPLCGSPKSIGRLCCWTCWNDRGPDHDPYFERCINHAETTLTMAADTAQMVRG